MCCIEVSINCDKIATKHLDTFIDFLLLVLTYMVTLSYIKSKAVPSLIESVIILKNLKHKPAINHLQIILLLLPYLWNQSWQNRFRFLLSVSLIIITICLNIFVPLSLKSVINVISMPHLSTGMGIFLLLISYGFIWTLSRITAQLRQIVMYPVFERSIRVLGLSIFEHLNNLSVSFHVSRKTGSITNAIDRIQTGIPNVLWGLFFLIIPTIIEIFISACILCYLYGIIYGMTSLVILTTFMLFSMAGTEWSVEAQRISNQKHRETGTRIVDSLLNFETIKYFANQRFESYQCDRILKEREDAVTRQLVRIAIVGVGQVLIVGMGLTLLTWLSGKAVIVGQLNISDFVLINGYLLQFIIPLSTFGFILSNLRQGLTDMEDVMELLSITPEILDAPNARPIKKEQSGIVFENVEFSYENQPLVINGLNFEVPSGKTIAIVGPTGAGKSTISRLLLRFYDINAGHIYVNGDDIRDVTQESLRNIIGVVPQDTVLFNNTIYYNIAYGCPEASIESVMEAVRVAHLDTFIENLPEGYYTIVGERGLKISGGERQRIAIARMLLKNPSIYVFDEATSALDNKTEKLIQENLQEISKKSTTLVIAHRLTTVTHADEILVLDKGLIVERGTHHALLKNGIVYQKLWNEQFLNN